MASRDQSKQRKLELLNELAVHRRDVVVTKQVLVKQISENKDQLKEQITNKIKEKINIPKMVSTKVKSSFTNNPKQWFIGSAVGGLFISKIIYGSVGSVFKKKKKKSSHGMLYSLAGMAAKPIVKSFLMNKAKDYMIQRYAAQQPREIYHEDEYRQDARHQ